MPAYPASSHSTIQAFIESRIPENHPITTANVKRILATVPVNERKLQFEFGAWFSSMVEASMIEPPYDTEYKHDLAVMTWGAPDLGSIQVRRGIEDVLYIDTEFHRDISRWETEASDWQGELDGLYQNFGAEATDGMVFVQTFASITPTSSSSSDDLIITDNQCHPEYAFRTSLEEKYGAPGERAYVVPSMIIALKSGDAPMEKVICEGLSYLKYLNHFRSLPDILDTYPAPNLEGFKDIWKYVVRAIDLLVSCPLGRPVSPVRRPSGPIIESLRQMGSRDVDIVVITKRIAQLVGSNGKSSAEEVQDNSEPSGSAALGSSSPLLKSMPGDEDDEGVLLPSGFFESDFPSELGEEYPDDPDDDSIDEEEREKQDEEDMLYLAQKAVLRKRNVKIVPLSSAVFNALMEEVKANHQLPSE
ncbi:hypothetical protein I203_100889 [Kwoniella mangroviensis CBS 8507]|uniref:uncharacterized protein n=1 Tax=Kwoniella mangroviensis CBS 8507 TaxID=1296122 RepID=UPI00080D3F79|nr:uncharacterized protein I203_02529 [Kwoniella mangroviensis CBS 8507]OCF67871.1 hypothetical protein I203_02529 [Kwoniella mangroviensis CBS 8507]